MLACTFSSNHFAETKLHRLLPNTLVESSRGESSQCSPYCTLYFPRLNLNEKKNYLQTSETNNRIITRLRLDKNKLNTCQGKYNNIPYDLRTCPHCPNRANTIETTEHFIAICPHYKNERDSFKTNISMNTALNRDIADLILYADSHAYF